MEDNILVPDGLQEVGETDMCSSNWQCERSQSGCPGCPTCRVQISEVVFIGED